MKDSEPIFNVPGAVLAVLAVLAAIHGLRTLLAPETDLWLVYVLAFIPARYDGLAAELPGGETAALTSFATHMLVHGDIVHLLLNSAWLLAFGGAIALRVGSARFLAFAIVCGIAGALTFLFVNPGLATPVVGASGAVSGLMGGAMRFLFSAIDEGGARRLREAPHRARLMSLPEALSDQRVLLTTAIWLLINVLATFGFGGGGADGRIAWETHIGGYVAGLLLFGLFDRPAPTESQPIQH